MDLKDKQKIVQLIGHADEALQKLEHNINSYEAQVKVISVVFEICDHDAYNKIFGYKKK
ncbi:hypothetical protein HZA97_07680 [Candidatus Woesearchaeota archaeon]|nr:hypothetical protein [Candidatus Woesearchaeota archaeon]